MTDAGGASRAPARSSRLLSSRLGWSLLVLLLAAVVGALPATRMRVRVEWHRTRLASSDPMVRTQARHDLLDIGRPAIDPVYPELVAGELADEMHGVADVALFVGTPTERATSLTRPPVVAYRVEQVLAGSDELRKSLASRPFVLDDAMVCPVAKRLVSPSAARQLVLAANVSRTPVLRVSIPLDDAFALAILGAVRERLDSR